jgi:hypothetical protein
MDCLQRDKDRPNPNLCQPPKRSNLNSSEIGDTTAMEAVKFITDTFKGPTDKHPIYAREVGTKICNLFYGWYFIQTNVMLPSC